MMAWYKTVVNSIVNALKLRQSCPKLSVYFVLPIDGVVLERCNSSALAMELSLSCTNPSICVFIAV